MKNFFAVALLLIAFTFGLMLTSCSKTSAGSDGGTQLNIPNMTAAVNGTTTASISETIRSYASIPLTQQSSGVLFTGSGPSDGVVNSLFGMVQSFVSSAKTSDSFACMIEVLASNNLLKTDGTETVFSDDQNSQFKAKFVVNATGTTLKNFKMYICSASGLTNDQYVEGTLAGSTMTFVMKFDTAGMFMGSLSMEGTVSGDAWSSKLLTMETYIGSGSPTYSTKFQIAQSATNMLLKGTFNSGTAATDYQMYGKFALLGNSPATYAMGEGSAKYIYGLAADAYKHWNNSGDATTATSSYAADVTSGTYFPTNFAFTGTMTSGQTWDCSAGTATEVKVTTMSAAVTAAVQSCMDNQE